MLMRLIRRASWAALLLAFALPATTASAATTGGDDALDAHVAFLSRDVASQVAQRNALDQRLPGLSGNLSTLLQFSAVLGARARLDANIKRDADAAIEVAVRHARATITASLQAAQGIKPPAFDNDRTVIGASHELPSDDFRVAAIDKTLESLWPDPITNGDAIAKAEAIRDQALVASQRVALVLADRMTEMVK
jgi:hypothetical protein